MQKCAKNLEVWKTHSRPFAKITIEDKKRIFVQPDAYSGMLLNYRTQEFLNSSALPVRVHLNVAY